MRASPTLWLLFGLKGRLSRSAYWPALIAIYCLNFALYFQLVGMTREEFEGWHPLLVLVGAIATLVIQVAVSVKRLHDVGYSGFLAAAVLIPILNVAFALWVGILPGTPGPNPYGPAPDAPAR